MSTEKPRLPLVPNPSATYTRALFILLGLASVAAVAHATWRNWPVEPSSLREVRGRVVDISAYTFSSGKTTQRGWYLALDATGGTRLILSEGRIAKSAVLDLHGKMLFALIGADTARQPGKIYDLRTDQGALIDLAQERRRDRNRAVLGMLLGGLLALGVGIVVKRAFAATMRPTA